MKRNFDIPLGQKFCLTVEEASAYSGISESRIRKIARLSDCSLTVDIPKKGRKVLIKRKAFEDYIQNLTGEEV